MAGRADIINAGWDLIRTKIRLDPPTKLADYLGCGQEAFWMNKDTVRETIMRIAPNVLAPAMPRETASAPTASGGDDATHDNFGTKSASATRYLMKGFLEQCVNRYIELANISK